MRLNNTVKQVDLYALATQTLKSYGVTTAIKNNAILFSFSENAADGETPLLISGRTLPEVPSTSRPIFYFYPLKALNGGQVGSWISEMFPKKDLKVMRDADRNALVFIGPTRIVQQAIAATKLLDKPMMQGMFSKMIQPSLSSVFDLADSLQDVLNVEGYNVSQLSGNSAIRLLPLESINQLVVFAKSPDILEHIIDWARILETEQHNKVDQGFFTYPVQNTQAVHIVELLNNLGVADFQSSDTNSSQSNSSQGSSNTASSSSQQNRPSSNNSNTTSNNSETKGRFAVDEQLNTILFSGSGKNWLSVLPVIQKLDKPAPSVMVEVILAEVRLGDEEKSGVEWLANASLGKFGLNFSTIGGLGLGGSGLTSSLLSTQIDTAGQTRAVLNAFYKNDKANIRSRPRIMVKSGGEASIDVGNEIPVVTSSSQGTTDANAPVIQTITYRKTGVILDIKPTVHASGFVDIEITQELSEAVGTASAETLSPTILNRRISTTVTLRDGGSVLLGGLISSTTSAGKQGIPILGRLPFIGKLFRSDTENQDRTELMIMIIPYILNSPEEAEQLTDELQKNRMADFSADLIIE
jgi:general secretion pathway protein D